jgi:hypothetical protein
MATALQSIVNYFVITEADGTVRSFPKKSVYYEIAKERIAFFVGKQKVAGPYPFGLTGTVDLTAGASGSVDGISVGGEEIMSGAKATAVLASVDESTTAATATAQCTSVVGNTFSTNTAQCTSVIATDTVTINGLLYTAVSGVKSDNTEFSVDTGDNECAADLADSVNNDVRSGTLGVVSASASTDTVTLTSDVLGVAGDATTLAQTGGTITLGGATFSGGVDADTITINGLLYTAVAGTKADNTEFSIDTDDDSCAADLADSVNNDVRVGTLGIVSASATTDTVTLTSDQVGTAGDATTLAETGTTITISGATFSGGDDPDQIVVNGLTYTAVAGTPADFTEFSTDTDDDATAVSLAAAVNGDTRSGTLGDVSASATTDTVTFTQTVGGAGGKATTLTENTSSGSITISGATFGGAEAFDTDLDTTAINVAANITAYSSNYSATAASGLITIKNIRTGKEVAGLTVTSEVTTISSTDVDMGVDTGDLLDAPGGSPFVDVAALLTFVRTNTGN